MREYLWRGSIAMVLLLGLTLTGCDDSDDDDDVAAAATVDVTGNWNVTVTGEEGLTAVMSLTQSGNAVTGTFTVPGMDGSLSMSGTVSGNTLRLTMVTDIDDNASVTLNGTVTDNTISGTWTDNGGDSGTWSATKQ